MTLSSKIRVGDDVFDKAVLPATTKEVWDNGQHARCDNRADRF